MAKLFVCGDVVNYTNENCFVGSNLKRIIQSADLAVCNLEGVERKDGTKTDYPSQHTGTIQYLKEVGFGLLLLANNHITDGGEESLKFTLNTIDDLKLNRVGAGLSWQETYQPKELTIDGISFAFYNLCEAQVGQYESLQQEYGYAWIGNKNILSSIAKKKKTVDHIVAFIHTGLEHYDLPLPEVRSYYKELCEAGVSCVVGGHTHCAQGYEYYGHSLIIYSLGNFFFPPTNRWPNEVSSYSVLLNFTNLSVSVEPIFHSNKDSQVSITDDLVQLNQLNEKLVNNYEDRSEKLIRNAWSVLVERLLMEATCGQSGEEDIKTICKKNIMYLFKRNSTIKKTKERRQKLLLRLFENETYKNIIIHYLKHN